MKPYDIVTFDCYGTLIDWRRGIADAFERAAAQVGVSVDVDRVLALHAEIEPLVQQATFKPYKEILRDVAARIMDRLAWPTGARPDPVFLPRSVGEWPAFPDTVESLGRMRTMGYRLGLLSNIDRDLIATTRERHLRVGIDLLVTAEDVRAYKPSHEHFHTAAKAIGEGGWLHAAQSYMHDVEPAVELDVPVVWVNRLGEAPLREARPSETVADLAGLVDWLAED